MWLFPLFIHYKDGEISLNNNRRFPILLYGSKGIFNDCCYPGSKSPIDIVIFTFIAYTDGH